MGKRRKAHVLDDSEDENHPEATVKLEPTAKRARTASVSEASDELDQGTDEVRVRN